jgi:hypothetical protein
MAKTSFTILAMVEIKERKISRFLKVRLADFNRRNSFILIIKTRRRFVPEMLCYRRRPVTGDVLLQRRSVTETFSKEMFCRGDVLWGDILYVRQYSI